MEADAERRVGRRAGVLEPEAAHDRYNEVLLTYNDVVSEIAHVMTVSRNGQVSIPASTRARWKARQVLVVDLGDRIVVRPVGDQPVEELRGKYAGRGPRTDRGRREARRVEADSTRRR